jgi:hypothetical protein
MLCIPQNEEGDMDYKYVYSSNSFNDASSRMAKQLNSLITMGTDRNTADIVSQSSVNNNSSSNRGPMVLGITGNKALTNPTSSKNVNT